MFSAFINCFKVKELRNRIIFTFSLIILCRILANIPCPAVDPQALSNYLDEFSEGVGGSVMGVFEIFSGGALRNFAIAALGIMPYITASIIMQLIKPVFPALEKMVREGEAGIQKFNQYTRYLTIVICIFYGISASFAMINPTKIGLKAPSEPLIKLAQEPHWGFIPPYIPFVIMTVIILTCGTMILVWLGEQITENGVGNGISLIITVNIISRVPQALYSLYDMVATGRTPGGTRFRLVHLLILLLVFIIVTAFTILLTQGQRRIPIQMARRGTGRGGATYLPLKVNYSGVMPIIFGSALMMVPVFLFGFFDFTRQFLFLFQRGSVYYMAIFAVIIIVFSFFWVATQFNPLQISDNLKRQSAYIPGIQPGQATADFLDFTMTRITLAGALFLAALAVFPMLLTSRFEIPFVVSSFFGGTSLLIMVGVTLDTLTQIESHLSMNNMNGFLKKGKMRGRRSRY